MLRKVQAYFGFLLAVIIYLMACSVCQAQMVTGDGMVGYAQTLGLGQPGVKSSYEVHLISSSAPGNVFWAGDTPSFTFQITNSTALPIAASGHIDLIAYGTHGAPGDVWTPHMFRIGAPAQTPFSVNIAANGYEDITVKPIVPSRFGGYALVVDLGSLGRQFATTFVRSLSGPLNYVQYPHLSLDYLPLPVLQRLGVHAIRLGVSYKATSAPDFDSWYADQGNQLKALQAAGVTVLFMVGGGDWDGPTQPLGHQRPWLDSNNVMEDTKFDLAWLPSYDSDFQDYTYRFARDYGWPKGPITAFSLWNEPWEGISISGWGADMLRYRDMYTHMWQGVDQARRENGADVLVGGGDSSMNAMDKFFPDGKDTFTSMFDFLSIHYQGLTSTANYKQWVDRKGYNGRVKIWDTESWVGNTDDRVAAIVAGDRAAGYDRAMGVFGGNICRANDYDQKLPDGKTQRVHTVDAWSTAASVGAASHFIGERPFKKLLFSNGLPWVMVFSGQADAKGVQHYEDGTVVVVGDLSEEFGPNILPLRTARGYAEIKHKAALEKQLRSAGGDAEAAIEKEIETPEVLSGAEMTVEASKNYSLYDFYGNPIAALNGKIVIPLDGRGFFLRANGLSGSFNQLLAALNSSKIQGIQPLAVVVHDLTKPLGVKPALRLSLTNVLNSSVSGLLSVTVGDLTVAKLSQKLSIGAHETRDILIPVSGDGVANNSYAVAVKFKPDTMLEEEYQENIHVNLIARRTIAVDGNLDDWAGVLPQTIIATGAAEPTLTEQAWLPFKSFDSAVHSGLATAYLAYDDNNFYFAAKVADSTPDPGSVRFATRDDDQYFYPQVSYLKDPSSPNGLKQLDWPAGVRRYSYRENPDLPSGNFPNFDNVQLAFNVLPEAEKRYYPVVPGTMPGFVSTENTDYEYALNNVAPQFGGGTEVWKLASPTLPVKNFYPRQPKAPGEGPVTDAKLVIRRDGDTLIYECSIPWTEMPEVKKRIDSGQTIKFSYRVNDNAGGPTMELSKGRSVAKINNNDFHVSWVEHWANELEFGAEK